METMRLNKFLAHAGVCSRREADKLIEQGKVLVNGLRPGPGQSVSAEDEITVSGKPVQGRQKTVVLAFYKPIGVTCTEKDVHAEKVISDYIHYPVRVTYAGRLDKDSEGLLLLTNDGNLIQSMMKGANRHEKEYVVKVNKEITPDFLEKMSRGVYLKDLDLATRECELKKIGKYTFQIVLTQGVNRQIRRMCDALGLTVGRLRRTAIGGVKLGMLKPGEWRDLTKDELRILRAEIGQKRSGSRGRR